MKPKPELSSLYVLCQPTVWDIISQLPIFQRKWNADFQLWNEVCTFVMLLHILKLMQLSEMKRERFWWDALWACMCGSRCELQQNVFHFLCSFALLKYLKVISLHKSISTDMWRERSLKPSHLLLLSPYGAFSVEKKLLSSKIQTHSFTCWMIVKNNTRSLW